MSDGGCDTTCCDSGGGFDSGGACDTVCGDSGGGGGESGTCHTSDNTVNDNSATYDIANKKNIITNQNVRLWMR
ncbi:uncharacterized protein LOC111684863 isoform X2 [Lucilia cuprina]|uniref:uncharacterized protein LOC111684863 isoform X2 n=1 Tax=Lucilia cuprina TaxID=7375 RepID=UPI001F05DF53|nr:uncharacterized protein LOC111684863 isoform X2 [Lucilia cuprina]